MQSTYLKDCLAKLAKLPIRLKEIESEGNRAELRMKYNLKPGEEFAATVGQLSGMVIGAAWDVEAAQRYAERLEVIEREHERLIRIFEALDLDLDEETLATLELIGRQQGPTEYREQARDIRRAISKAVTETQETERDFEHDQATDALIAAGFTYDEDDDFTRSTERVTITLVNGRECRYEWQLENASGEIDRGKSGEFSRLLALITPKSQEVAQ